MINIGNFVLCCLKNIDYSYNLVNNTFVKYKKKTIVTLVLQENMCLFDIFSLIIKFIKITHFAH